MPNVVDVLITARNAVLPGLAAAQADIEGWTRDAEGRLHDASGRFVAEGRQAGRGYGGGMVDALTDSLKPIGMILSTGFVAPAVAAAGAAAAAFASAGAAVGAFALAVKPQLEGISKAVEAYAKKDEEAARSSVSNTKAIEAAKKQLANAQKQAGKAHEEAVRQEERAEKNLTAAQEDARQAQLDLNEARKEAADDMKELAKRVDEAQFDMQDAALSVAEAQAHLNEVLADPEATDLQKQRAALALEQAKRSYAEQEDNLKKLKEQQQASDAAGVEGSKKVQDAKENVKDANEKVSESEKELAEARKHIAEVDKQSADAIAAARLAVAMASQQAGAATTTFADELAKLPPASRETALAFIAMKDELKAWSDGLAPKTMPVLTEGINILRAIIPELTPLVEAAADAFHNFLGGIRKDVEGGGLKDFIGSLTDASKETLPDFLNSAKNIAIGIGGIISAFLPFSGTVTGGIEEATAAFAEWGQSLKDSAGFRQFIDFVKEEVPHVLEFLKHLALAAVDIAKGLGPLGGVSLLVAESLAKIVDALPDQVLQALVPVIAAIVAVMKLWAIAQAALNAVMLVNPVILIIAALAGLVAILVYAYKHSETFRNIVNEAWKSISDAVMPIIEAIWKSIKEDLVPAFMDLIDALKPVVAWFIEQMVPYVREAFASFMMIVQGAVNIIIGIIKVFTGILTGDWEKVWEGLGQILEGAMGIFAGIIRQAINTIATIWRVGMGALANITTAIGEALGRAASSIASGFVNGVSTAWNWIGNALGWLRDRIFGFFKGAGEWLKNAGEWMVYGLANGIYTVASWVGNAIRAVIPDWLEGYIPGFAHGGIVGAAGGGPRSGLVLVGEQGPELVRMAPGSTVIPHGKTRSMLEGGSRGGGGGDGVGTLYLDSAGSRMDDLLIELLRMAIRDRGGDVQVVLGRG